MDHRPTHLVTFLGTGDYKAVTFRWPDASECHTALFPTALARHFSDATSGTVFVTTESDDKYRSTLEQDWPHPWRPEFVRIEKGSTPDELWSVFGAVVAAVPRDSRVVFDITHGFRSLPLVSVLAVAFLWTARNVQLRALVYGAFEARTGDPPVAPVFDLTPMVNLLEWIAAVERFRHHLDGEPLQHLLETIQRQAHKDKSENPPRQLSSIGKALNRLSDALLLGRVREVITEAPRLSKSLASENVANEAGRWAKPFGLMLEPLQSLFAQLGGQSEADLDAHRRLAEVYNERGLYPQAITLLREWLISEACRLAGLSDAQILDANERERIEKILGQTLAAANPISGVARPTDSWLDEFAQAGLLAVWLKVPDVRNDIDHAGMRLNPQSANSLIDNVEKLFEQTKRTEVK